MLKMMIMRMMKKMTMFDLPILKKNGFSAWIENYENNELHILVKSPFDDVQEGGKYRGEYLAFKMALNETDLLRKAKREQTKIKIWIETVNE